MSTIFHESKQLPSDRPLLNRLQHVPILLDCSDTVAELLAEAQVQGKQVVPPLSLPQEQKKAHPITTPGLY